VKLADHKSAGRLEGTWHRDKVLRSAVDAVLGELGFSVEDLREVSDFRRSVYADLEATRLVLGREVSAVKSELEILSKRVRDLEGLPTLVSIEGRLELLEAKVEALVEAVKNRSPLRVVHRDSS
jgi:hypothetical protein